MYIVGGQQGGGTFPPMINIRPSQSLSEPFNAHKHMVLPFFFFINTVFFYPFLNERCNDVLVVIL